MQYGAIFPPGNIQQMYSPYQGYLAPAGNDNHHNENIPNSQPNISRGGGRGMNRRGGAGGGRNRGGGNMNNGNMNSRRQNNEYRQNNNQQSALNQNSMNSNDYNLMDHHQTVLNPSHYQPVYFHYQYGVPGSAIPATAQNLTGQPLFAVQQQPIYINPYGQPYPAQIMYNYMPPQMPQIQSDVIESDQSGQGVNLPSPAAAVYQAIPPYQLAYQPEHHHYELCETPLSNADRIEFQGAMPEDEYQLQMINPNDGYVVESNEVPIIEDHDVVPLVESDYQSVYDHKELIDKTRDLIIQTAPADMSNQYLDHEIIIDEDENSEATTLQFINDSEESELIEQEHQQQQLLLKQQQQQQPTPPLQQPVQNRKPTNFVPTPSNPTTMVKKQTASVSVSAIPNKHFEEVKMNEFNSEEPQQIHQSHSQRQQQQQQCDNANQNTNKNSFSSITASKHSPKSLKDEKKTELIIKQNDSQKTTLSEQAKQQIASTISNSEPSSNKKDKMETAGPTIANAQIPLEKDSKTTSTSPITSLSSSSAANEKIAQNAKQSTSAPHSWAGLFQSAESASSAPLHAISNQIKQTTTSKDVDNMSQSNIDNSVNNKAPGTMSYSAVSQSVNKMKPNTASIATSTSSPITNNNEASSNVVDAPKPAPVDQNALKLGGEYWQFSELLSFSNDNTNIFQISIQSIRPTLEVSACYQEECSTNQTIAI